MPKLKHNFLKGRMNKDLDERLVPNGEYRDALNIEISTSEDSNTGAVQNVKGNAKVTVLDYEGNDFMNTDISDNAISVGVCTDEVEGKIYNLIHLASDLTASGDYPTGTRFIGVKSDVITEFTKDVNAETGSTFPIVVDAFESRHAPKGPQTSVGLINGTALDLLDWSNFNGNLVPKGVRPGMRLQLVSPNGVDAYGVNNEVFVTKINYNSDPNLVSVETTIPALNSVGAPILLTQAMIDAGYVYKFTSPRILNFLPGSTEQEVNVTDTPTSYTPNKNIITGLNLYNDILFFTDNRNEPKRIVLENFRKNNFEHTSFNQRIQLHSLYFGNIYLEEEHITVAKRPPKLAPKFKIFQNERNGGTSSIIGTPNNGQQQTFNLTTEDSIGSGQFVPLDSNFSTAIANNTFNILTAGSVEWEVGDYIDISGVTTGIGATILVNSINVNGDPNIFNITVVDIDQGYLDIEEDASNPGVLTGFSTTNRDPELWFAQLASKKSLYETSFVFFSYRYKYQNDEISPLAPYSRAAFIPGFYEFYGKKGFNKGMENHIDKIILYDFVEQEAKNTNDIKEVQIVFKSSSSENPIIARTIKFTEAEFNDRLNFLSKNSGVFEIKSEVFGRSIQTKQQLRINDNVPRKALAQEISSSRLLLGNYLEGFNIPVTIKTNHSFKALPPSDQTAVIFSDSVFNFKGTFSAIPEAQDPEDLSYGFGTFMLSSQQYLGILNSNRDHLGTTWGSSRLGVDFGSGEGFGDGTDNPHLSYPHDWPGGDPIGNTFFTDPYAGNLPGVGIRVPDNSSTEYTYVNPAGVLQRFPINHIEQGASFWSTATPIVGNGTSQGHMGSIGENAYIIPQTGYYEVSCNVPRFFVNCQFMRNGGVENVREAGVPYVRVLLTYLSPNNTRYVLDEYNDNDFKKINNYKTAFEFGDRGLYGNSSSAPGAVFEQGGKIFLEVFKMNFRFRENFGAGLFPATHATVSMYMHIDKTTRKNHLGHTMTVNGPPSFQTITIPSTTPSKSVKSDTEYQIGVVYGDFYGRETPVLVDDKNRIEISKSNSTTKNLLITQVENEAPAFADYYKFYVKEVMSEYYNLVMHSAYPADLDEFFNSSAASGGATQTGFTTSTSEAWLAFNSADRSKIEIDDYLVQKKQHGTVVSVTDEEAKWRVLDIVDNAVGDMTSPSGANLSSSTSFEINGVDLLNASFEDINGKFFVKIKADDKFDEHIGGVGAAAAAVGTPNLVPGSNAAGNNGAVFEIRKKDIKDLDLFYEVSQAFPIKLTNKNAHHYINTTDVVKIFKDFNSNLDQEVCDAFNEALFIVEEVNGAKSFGYNQLNSVSSNDPTFGEGLVEIRIGATGPVSGNASAGNPGISSVTLPSGSVLSSTHVPIGSIISFENPDNGFVSGEVVNFGAADDKKIYIKPFSCLTSSSSKILPIGLNWWNVISFGNGVESDRIRDDFNADSVYKYTAVGKQSGFEASIQNEDYKEVRYENNIIFSQIFSAALGGGYNEFIAVEDIVKQVNTEYGSIQKLFTRDGDVVTFCENKVLRILSSGKDALFNAEGKAEIIKSTNVLGQAIPYLGDYGISNNPESFAAEEYRLYFADKNRGAICRLSRDGITPISDAGMRDFFNDHLANAQSIIGSYDGKKNEYNITIHEVINPNVKKNVFTLGYKENVKGWTSFKSFIKEQGISLQNNYYTFKNSLCYLHHPDTLAHTYCKFYSTTNNASITDIFSESSEVVKLYKTVSYEGTQSKVVKFTDEVVDGVTYNDNEYYNATAKKGWFVESITTDMQEGDIDEFIEKEGKWHNFIKGIETTFTNASDNNGVADGNIDFNEFSIQGIGNLKGNATVQSGTVPGTGFDVNITMSPCSSVPNLFSASNFYQANVIDNLNTFVNANAATVTITPSANYCIAAADFTADFPNVTLPSGVNSIIFSDTTTPYAFDNEVVATFNLQTNFTLSSDFTIDVPICVTPVLLPINYEAVINVNGDFYSTVPMTVSYNFGSGLTSPSIVPFGSTATSQSYLFTATIPQNYNGSLIDITVLNGSNVFTSDPTVAFTDITSTTPNTISPEQQNYNFNTNHQPHLNSSVQIDYTPISTNQSTIDNNNTIEITTNFIGQFLQFVNSNFTTGLPTAMPGSIIIDTLGGSFTYGVSTNAGNYTATIDSDPDNIINNLSFVQNTSNLSLSTPNVTTTSLGVVQIDVNPNTGSTALSATIKITSDNNPLLQDTLVINQPLGFELNATAAWHMVMLNTFNQIEGYYFGDTNLPVSGSNTSTLIQNAFQENLNIAPFIYPSQGSGSINAGFGGVGASSVITILINHNADSTQSSTFLTLSDISFIDTGDGTNWVNVDNFSFNSVGNNGLPDGGFIELSVDPNTTGTTRSLTVQIPHPHNSSFTDSIIITQAQGFNSGVNTVVFKEPTSTTAVDGVFVAAGTASGITDEIHFDNTAQVVDIFFKIPDADANAQINVGLFGTDVSGFYNNTNQSYVFDQWNENDGVAPDFIPYADTISTINTGGWFASPPTVQYEQFVFPGPGGVSTDVNYKITIQLEENNASLGSSFSASWQNQFPVDRYCNIEVFNPHDNGIYPTGTLRLKQKAIKAVRFMQGNTQSGFGYSATFIQLGTYGYNSTHNYSTLIPAIRANGSTPQLELVYYDTHANAQNQNSSGAISASWFNLQQTPVLAALSIDFSYNIQVDNIEPNFGLSHRYCAISAYHSDLDISTTTVSPNTLDGTDIIIFEQPNIVPIIAFDPTYTSNAIHNTVIADNGQSYVQTQEVTATFSAGSFSGTGPFTFTMPINHNAQAPDTPTITFIEATNDFGSTQPTGNHPSFFTTTDLAACSISSTTGLMTIQVSELPTSSVFSFKLRATHPNNPQFFAELTIIYS